MTISFVTFAKIEQNLSRRKMRNPQIKSYTFLFAVLFVKLSLFVCVCVCLFVWVFFLMSIILLQQASPFNSCITTAQLQLNKLSNERAINKVQYTHCMCHISAQL